LKRKAKEAAMAWAAEAKRKEAEMEAKRQLEAKQRIEEAEAKRQAEIKRKVEEAEAKRRKEEANTKVKSADTENRKNLFKIEKRKGRCRRSNWQSDPCRWLLQRPTCHCNAKHQCPG